MPRSLPSMTPAAALEYLRPGDRVFIHTGCAVPVPLVEALDERARAVPELRAVHHLTLGAVPHALPGFFDRVRTETFFVTAGTRDAVGAGRADYTPALLSQLPALIHDRTVPVDVALLQLSPPDEDGRCSLGISVDIALAAALAARNVIAEINHRMPRTHGHARIPVSRLDAVVETDRPLIEAPREPASETARRIARFIAGLVPDGAVVQAGIGSMPEAALDALEGHQRLSVHSGLLGEGFLDLIEAGAVTNEAVRAARGSSVASIALGTERLYRALHENSCFQLRPADRVISVATLARIPRFHAINGALAVDLAGQVSADSLGGAVYSGIGGLPDFVRGARLSPGGRSIIAIPSTARGGAESRIVASFAPGSGVAVGRGEVDYVVTEHGIAELRGRTLREQAAALIRIAHPRFREALTRDLASTRDAG